MDFKKFVGRKRISGRTHGNFDQIDWTIILWNLKHYKP